MKKAIYTIALLGMAISVKAQTKQYQPSATDWQKQLSFMINVTAGQLVNYSIVLQNGGPQGISSSDKFKGNEITAYTKDYFTVMDSLNSAGSKAYASWYKTNEAKWVADTLRAFKTKKP